MPGRALRPCGQPGCSELTQSGYCEKHKRPNEQRYDQHRENAAQRGYDGRWQKSRIGFLAKHPLCVMCEAEGQLTAATVVDHITPHRGDKQLFWDRSNWQPLCKPHHDRKTAREDGGFGNVGRW